MSRALLSIAEVIEQPEFPAVDVALRKGCHIDREDGDWFALLHDGQEHVEAWYRRYGCELIYKTDGYFYLLPTSDKFPKRQLGASEMLVGQTLALLYLDPRTVERGGVITREAIVEQLVTVLGADTLISAFLPNRKRLDERVAQKEVRSKIADATRKLSTLGFATQLPDDKWQLRASVMRFAEPVRGVEDPMEALSRLVAEGDVSLEDLGEAPDETAGDADENDDVDPRIAASPAVIRRRGAKAASVAGNDDEDETSESENADVTVATNVAVHKPVNVPVPVAVNVAVNEPVTVPVTVAAPVTVSVNKSVSVAAPVSEPVTVIESAPVPTRAPLPADTDDDAYAFPSDDDDDDDDDDDAYGAPQDDE